MKPCTRDPLVSAARLRVVGTLAAIALLLVTVVIAQAAAKSSAKKPAAKKGHAAKALKPEQPGKPYDLKIPGSLATLRMVAIPGPHAAKPTMWISATEVTWEAYDPFRPGQEPPKAPKTAADAVSRPSHPYGEPDRGFGHKGYPAISVTYNAAQQYCRWLSLSTGRKYRLPTEAEWENACRAGGADAALDAAALNAYAWFADNSGGTTHPVAKKAPNAWGLYDLLGNAGEWCTGKDGKPVLCGGTFQDPAGQVSPTARAHQDPSWNERDPQLPKSKWWLSDGPFAGFRIVRVP